MNGTERRGEEGTRIFQLTDHVFGSCSPFFDPEGGSGQIGDDASLDFFKL
jgi:hypothetical protein